MFQTMFRVKARKGELERTFDFATEKAQHDSERRLRAAGFTTATSIQIKKEVVGR